MQNEGRSFWYEGSWAANESTHMTEDKRPGLLKSEGGGRTCVGECGLKFNCH